MRPPSVKRIATGKKNKLGKRGQRVGCSTHHPPTPVEFIPSEREIELDTRRPLKKKKKKEKKKKEKKNREHAEWTLPNKKCNEEGGRRWVAWRPRGGVAGWLSKDVDGEQRMLSAIA